MALYSLRLRRALSLSSSLLTHYRPLASLSTIPTPSLSFSTLNPQNHSLDLTKSHHNNNHLLHVPFQSRTFRSSTVSLSSRVGQSSYNRNNAGDEDKIDPNGILFEGCDYNHWLITMDFPKDPKPTPEEMVETFVQTCAKVVGSVEEAKKRIYACSTTTYQGFNVLVTEEMSEKFRGLPGVVFILPDSYIDPVNKEYGGDKYINGTIIPRPPPVQYGRHGGRYGDRNREVNRPNQPRDSYQQGNLSYDNQGSMHGDTRNFSPQQNHPPQQNYYPPRAGERRDPIPMNNVPRGRDNSQGDPRDTLPSYYAHQGNYYPQGQRDFPARDQRNYAPPEQRDFRVDNRNYAPSQGETYGQGAGGTYGQGAGGTYGQGVSSGYAPRDSGHGENQSFSQVDERNNMQGQQRNHAVMGETGTGQGRY